MGCTEISTTQHSTNVQINLLVSILPAPLFRRKSQTMMGVESKPEGRICRVGDSNVARNICGIHGCVETFLSSGFLPKLWVSYLDLD